MIPILLLAANHMGKSRFLNFHADFAYNNQITKGYCRIDSTLDIVSIDTPVIDSRKDLFGSLSVNEELLSHTISSNRYGGLSMIQQPHINAKDENNTYQVDSENFGDFIEVIDSFRFLVNTESMANKQGRKEANKNLSDLGNTMIASSDFMDLLSDAEMVDNGDHFTYTICLLYTSDAADE